MGGTVAGKVQERRDRAEPGHAQKRRHQILMVLEDDQDDGTATDTRGVVGRGELSRAALGLEVADLDRRTIAEEVARVECLGLRSAALPTT